MKTITEMANEHGITPAKIRGNIAARKRVALANGPRRRLRCLTGPWAGYEIALPAAVAMSRSTSWRSLSLTINGECGHYKRVGMDLMWIKED